MAYKIVFARSARRELQRLPKNLVKRLFRRIESLADEPRPHGTRKLQGTDDLWRVRSGDYRVIYRVSDTEQLVDIIAVRHRRDAYR